MRRAGLALALLLVVAVGGCRQRRRAAVIEGLVREVAAPAYAELASRAQRLAAAAEALAAAPERTALEAARARWQEAIGAWRSTFAFRPAALTRRAPHFRAAYFPPEPRLIDGVLAGAGGLDDAAVSALGVSAKGMFVLERLLWGARGQGAEAVLAALQDPAAGPRRRAYLRALARVAAGDAQDASRLVAAPELPRAFAAEGQAALNRLVNDIVAVVESTATARVAYVLDASATGVLRASPVEGEPSGTSGAIALALVDGVARIYGAAESGGLARLTQASSAAADAALQAAFEHALASLRRVGPSLEQAAARDRPALAQAAADLRALEVAMKTSLVSALGVTLTFTAGDGD